KNACSSIIVEVHVTQEQTHMKVSTPAVIALVTDFLDFSKVKYDEVSIYFVDTPAICELHKQYFNDSSVTDCISFPMDDVNEIGYRVMGDVFVCPETASNYIASYAGDVYHEITLYVIHGLLHLLGFDDIDDEDAKEMRQAEKEYLAHVAAKKLWLHS